MNTAIHFLYGEDLSHGEEQCYLCGASCKSVHSVAKGIADTFNSHYLAACPSSAWLCDACQWYFNDKSHPTFRKMSIVVCQDIWGEWRRELMKQDIQRWLEDGLPAESYLVVSLSKKKHILLQAPLNAKGSTALSIQIEEQVAHVNLASWTAIGVPFLALMKLGHNKGEILSGELYSSTLRKHGKLIEALRLSEQLNQWRSSALIDLYSYTTIVEEKEDGESGITADRAGLSSAHDHLESNRSRVQETVSGGNMATIRGKNRSSRKNDANSPGVHQPSLFDV